MAKQSRNVLKNFFKNGNLLSQREFSDLIDSSWNINDDGLNKTNDEGLQLSPVGASQKIMSFYSNNIDEHPNWQLGIDLNQTHGLSLLQPEKESTPALFLSDNGNVGIHTTAPATTLDIHGSLSSKARIGTYKIGKVKADAQWHTILSGLQGCNVFEIVAEAKGNPGDGNYTLAHAIAMKAGDGGTIKVVKSSNRWFDFRDKIRFRWQGTPDNYSLQIRTGKHYFLKTETKDTAKSVKKNAQHTTEVNDLKFHICRLWDDNLTFDSE
jgi:hypothetical protein